VISGPGLTSLVAVLSATVQSTIDVAMRRAYAHEPSFLVGADPDAAPAEPCLSGSRRC
jgi:hypothetical protein